MYNSIASVELVTRMQSQFAGIFLPGEDHTSVAPGHGRRLLITLLRALANRLEPIPAVR